MSSPFDLLHPCDSRDNGAQTKVGPMGALTPNIGPGRPNQEVDVVHILPLPADAGHPPHEIARMARADGCPDACGNLELPYRIEDEPNGFRAYYGCENCGQFWNTGWGEC